MHLFLDLDGTIVGRTNALTPHLIKAVKEARDAGVKFSICTGRTNRGLSKEIEQILGPDGPHIFENGAAVVYPDGRIVKSWPIPHEVGKAIADVAMELGKTLDIAAEFYSGGRCYVSKKTQDAVRHAHALKIDPDDVIETDVREIAENQEILRVQWVGKEDAMKIALKENPKETSVGVASAHACPNTLFASVTAQGVDKGRAVRYVAEEIYGVDVASCYAAGDSQGDVPMLKTVGHPFVMGNASQELRATYPAVKSVEQDGVIEIINQILKSKTD